MTPQPLMAPSTELSKWGPQEKEPGEGEQRNLLRLYCVLLLINFLLEIIAGVLAYVYYQQLNAELMDNLRDTMKKGCPQPGHKGVTSAVDRLQQEFYCCGSNNLQDWQDSEWIRLGQLETLIQEHLRISGAVGLGITCVQVFSVPFTSCRYRSLKLERCCPCPREPALCVRRSSSRCGDY
ncbi:unnamed protein product [Rangifer tarandus platyrhynchus]|uniref:Uncharacterized protein n=2 Tax=Rangifer tarandus platyrhynchus TaxID=3082113 RepID=A0ACB0E4T4_RANTA|nr:unnamed protein product [Rangifer tarandus platyrhynchus]CAI9695595.1 unnamed protein product [Rangifer tarandus platyrhynchus]